MDFLETILQHRRVLLDDFPVKVENLPAGITACLLGFVVLLQRELSVGVDANHTQLEAIKHECKISFKVLAAS